MPTRHRAKLHTTYVHLLTLLTTVLTYCSYSTYAVLTLQITPTYYTHVLHLPYTYDTHNTYYTHTISQGAFLMYDDVCDPSNCSVTDPIAAGPALATCDLEQASVRSRLISPHLTSSRLISPHLASSRLIS